MELTGKKINFIGDSITMGFGTSGAGSLFMDRMAARAGIIPRDYGFCATTIARQIDPLHEIDDRAPCFCDRLDEMDPDADVIIVFGGTNDYDHGTAPLGHPDDRTPNTFWGACHFLIRALYERYPAATVVFLTPLHRIGENTPGQFNARTLQLYVDIIRVVCEQYAVPVCDLYAQAGFTPSLPVQYDRYIPDGLHPNDAGHELIATRLINFLRTL